MKEKFEKIFLVLIFLILPAIATAKICCCYEDAQGNCTDCYTLNTNNCNYCPDTAVCKCTQGACGGGRTETNCADGKDNDGDGKTDCADPDCNGRYCGYTTINCPPYCSGNKRCTYPSSSVTCSKYCSGGTCKVSNCSCGTATCQRCNDNDLCTYDRCQNGKCIFPPKCSSRECCDIYGNCVASGGWGEGVSNPGPCKKEYCDNGIWKSSICLMMGDGQSGFEAECDPDTWNCPYYTIPWGTKGACIDGTCWGLKVCMAIINRCCSDWVPGKCAQNGCASDERYYERRCLTGIETKCEYDEFCAGGCTPGETRDCTIPCTYKKCVGSQCKTVTTEVSGTQVCQADFTWGPCQATCPSDQCQTNADCRQNRPPKAKNLRETIDNCAWGSIPQVAPGLSIILRWDYSDPDGDPQASYEIWLDDSPAFSDPKFTFKTDSSSHSYSLNLSQDENGDFCPKNYPDFGCGLKWGTTYYWKVRVKDTKGNWSSWSSVKSFTTPSHASPLIDFSWSPQNPGVLEVVSFEDLTKCYDPSDNVVPCQSWYWEFEDGVPSSSHNQNATTSFQSPGTKKVSLTVTDSSGYSCQKAKNLNILYPLPFWKEIPPFMSSILRFLQTSATSLTNYLNFVKIYLTKFFGRLK